MTRARRVAKALAWLLTLLLLGGVLFMLACFFAAIWVTDAHTAGRWGMTGVLMFCIDIGLFIVMVLTWMVADPEPVA